MQKTSEKQVRLDSETWLKLKIMSAKENKTMRQFIKELINNKENHNRQ